jgi:hypothetical protein
MAAAAVLGRVYVAGVTCSEEHFKVPGVAERMRKTAFSFRVLDKPIGV